MDYLDRAASKASARRFTGASVTGFVPLPGVALPQRVLLDAIAHLERLANDKCFNHIAGIDEVRAHLIDAFMAAEKTYLPTDEERQEWK